MKNILGIGLQVVAALLAITTIIGAASDFGPVESVALCFPVLLLAVGGYKLRTATPASAPTAN
ncbi:MAG: hypothetical protein ACR2IR_00895 [Acidimicrobiia bacterium]